jgi:poly(3-hydroxybutyrate) depolymerase
VKLSVVLVLALGLSGESRAQTSNREPDLVAELERAVDQPTAAERRQAAIALASRCAGRVEDLEAAARAFGRFEALESGMSKVTASLRVGDAVEETELVVYVPSGYDPGKAAPAVLAFHGTGGRGREMASMWRDEAERAGALLLAPSEAGANEGYAFSERERLAALAALRWLRRRANVDENAVFATGVSRGGHLAWDLALRYPDLFAGIAPMIGSPRITIQRGQNNLRYVENVAHLSIRDLQGERDDPALVASVRTAFEKLAKLGARDARLFLQPEHGHSFDPKAVDWPELFSARRDPSPRRVVRASARKGEGRASWLEVLDHSPSVDETFTPKISQLGWAQLDEDGRLAYLESEAEQRTARIQAERAGVGRFSASSKGVKRFRLLLAREDFDAGRAVEVAWNGDTLRVRPKPSPGVLLEDFVERFDRTFVPVAEIEVR